MAWWRPIDNLEEADVERGLKLMIYDGMCSQVMGVLTGGAFLVAFALLLGASNKVIGLIAALGPMTQIVQIPAIFIVDSLKRRKLLVTGSAFLGRLFLLAIAGIPFLAPSFLFPTSDSKISRQRPEISPLDGIRLVNTHMCPFLSARRLPGEGSCAEGHPMFRAIPGG